MKWRRLEAGFDGRQIPRPRVTYTHLHHPSAGNHRYICERWLAFEVGARSDEPIFFVELTLDSLGLSRWGCRKCLRAE